MNERKNIRFEYLSSISIKSCLERIKLYKEGGAIPDHIRFWEKSIQYLTTGNHLLFLSRTEEQIRNQDFQITYSNLNNTFTDVVDYQGVKRAYDVHTLGFLVEEIPFLAIIGADLNEHQKIQDSIQYITDDSLPNPMIGLIFREGVYLENIVINGSISERAKEYLINYCTEYNRKISQEEIAIFVRQKIKETYIASLESMVEYARDWLSHNLAIHLGLLDNSKWEEPRYLKSQGNLIAVFKKLSTSDDKPTEKIIKSSPKKIKAVNTKKSNKTRVKVSKKQNNSLKNTKEKPNKLSRKAVIKKSKTESTAKQTRRKK